MGAIVFLVILGILAFLAIGIYNGLVRSRNEMKNAFAQIDVQLKRRHDLVPNLVESAKAVMGHERETLVAVIQARNQALPALQAASARPDDGVAVQKLGAAEAALSNALGRFFALAESYPALKAQEAVGALMEELSSTENRIGFARQAFNDAVMGYNNRRETFPAMFFATGLGFKEAALWEITNTAERENVKVDFARR